MGTVLLGTADLSLVSKSFCLRYALSSPWHPATGGALPAPEGGSARAGPPTATATRKAIAAKIKSMRLKCCLPVPATSGRLLLQ